ncbi:hypothetical protein CC80DRAFT_531078 [Byssothecium circinans]|uniref:Uncharacterized protein n=1 Tax=Byssothecium circinans TaxID=147558 RepID=A0A6A5ULZ4_9PLEO|nr:hypothetical protein CC80DRAFT_531078 [Byssothecium circinans]
MMNNPQCILPPTRRFQRIAADLEKLPCELHEDVLVELEFESIIRLSKYAGPRLTWSIENSPSAWGKFFRGGYAAELRKFLLVTDQIKALCLKPPKEKREKRPVFDSKAWSFLYYRNADWASPERRTYVFDEQHSFWTRKCFWYGNWAGNTAIPLATQNRLVDFDIVAQHWRTELLKIVSKATQRSFKHHYDVFIAPWITKLEDVHGTLRVSVLRRTSDLMLSIDNLATFIDVYQDLRRMRAAALAGELRRLADLYDAHPYRLKMPFAPQSPRKNEKHVPNHMRYQADLLVKQPSSTPWIHGARAHYAFAYPFPCLVPYNCCISLFDAVLHKHDLSEPIFSPDIAGKCKFLVKEKPEWVEMVIKIVPECEIPIPQGDYDKAKPFRKRQFEEGRSTAYVPHEAVHLEWLEVFMVVVAWMEKEFPDLSTEAKGQNDSYDTLLMEKLGIS